VFTAKLDWGDEKKKGEFIGALTANLCPLEREIAQDLFGRFEKPSLALNAKSAQERQGDHWWSDRPWTGEVIRCLRSLGSKRGHLVYPESGQDEGDPQKLMNEWLFDVVWMDAPGEDWQQMTALRLACESEWGRTRDKILEDFLKLTVVLCDLRLLIYTNQEVPVGQEKHHPVDICKSVCPPSRSFRYLLVGTSYKNGFRVDAWTA
jgi:hypothetical protein